MVRASPRRALILAFLGGGLVMGCGSRGNDYSLLVGSDDAGGSFVADDARTPGPLDAYIEQGNVEVEIVTLNCSGDCATVKAVATGGYPPYSFVWDDGATSPERKVCPTSSTSYQVTVTDQGSSGEFPRPPEAAHAPLRADVLSCPDAGAVCDGGDAGFKSGHYVGTVYCPPDGGVISVPSADGGGDSGAVTFDLSFNGTTVDGSMSFLWSVGGLIEFQAGITGAVDCSTGELHATWENAHWGVPVPGQDGGVIGSNPATGRITALPVPGSPGTISGAYDYVVSTGSCMGSYIATLQP